MNILAFDCGGRSCRAAVVGEAGALAPNVLARGAVEDRGQAEALVPLLSALVAEAGLAWSGIGLIAVTVGPGRFTGVRIALAAASGMALAGGIPVAGVASFAALAHGVAEEQRRGRNLVAVIDGGGRRLFAQVFGEDLNPIGLPLALAPEEMPAALALPRPLLVGDGAARLLPLWPGAELASAPLHPDPEIVARLARQDFLAGRALPPVPLYLQPPDVSPSAG